MRFDTFVIDRIDPAFGSVLIQNGYEMVDVGNGIDYYRCNQDSDTRQMLQLEMDRIKALLGKNAEFSLTAVNFDQLQNFWETVPDGN